MDLDDPWPVEEAQILGRLARTDLAPDDRIRAVLSAVYNAERTEFAGDVLLREFEEASYPEKPYLLNVFETFYDMRETVYRLKDAQALAAAWEAAAPERARDTASWRDFARQHAALMAQRARRKDAPPDPDGKRKTIYR